jgi:hypothetical protein
VTAGPSVERHATWVAALAGLLAGLLTMTTHPVGIFYDDAIYLLTARALAEGQGYVYPHLPGTPDAIHYPPGWPLMLAAAWKLVPRFPENVAWLKLINPLLLAATAAGMVVAGRRLFALPAWAALAVALAAVTAIPVLTLANVLLSEPLFLALLFPALLACERLARPAVAPGPDGARGSDASPGRWRDAAIAATLTAAVVLTRTIAGVVFIATVLVLLRDRRWRPAAAYGLTFIVLVLPWQLFVWRASPGFPDELRGSYGPYLEWVIDGYRAGGWSFLRDVIVQNALDGWRMVGAFVAPLVRGTPRHAMTALATLALAASLVVTWRGGAARVTALALAGYLLAVVAWPYQTERFLWAVWPLLLLVPAAGVATLWSAPAGAPRTARRWAVLAAGTLLAAGHLTYNARALARGWADSASEQMTRNTLPIVQYVLEETRLVGRVIAADASPMVALYTGQQVVPVDILTPEEHLRAKSAQAFADELSRIDRRYAPASYIFLPIEGRVQSLPLVRFGGGRQLRGLPSRGYPLYAYDVVVVPDTTGGIPPTPPSR